MASSHDSWESSASASQTFAQPASGGLLEKLSFPQEGSRKTSFLWALGDQAQRSLGTSLRSAKQEIKSRLMTSYVVLCL